MTLSARGWVSVWFLTVGAAFLAAGWSAAAGWGWAAASFLVLTTVSREGGR